MNGEESVDGWLRLLRRFFGREDVLLRPCLEGAGGLDSLEFALRTGKRALHAALRLPETVQERNLGLGAGNFVVDVGLADLHASQFPLGDGHLFEVEEFSGGTGLPFGFENVAKVVELLAIFTGKDDGTGAEAVTEGVQPDSCLSFGSAGASR